MAIAPMSSLEEALDDETVDVILIATPNDVHKEIAVQALEAGKHVICEKPVTLTSEELSEIMHTAKEQGPRIYGPSKSPLGQ